MKKKTMIVIALVLIVPIVALVLNFTQTTPSQGSIFINLSDYSDDRVLVGGAKNVFAAKVIAHVSSESISDIPAEQFSAEVISNLKGDLPREVIVEQFVNYEFGTTPGQGGLIKPGSTYIFATLNDPVLNRQTIISHLNAHTLVIEDASLSSDELGRIVKGSDKYAKLVEALKHPISPEEDRANRNRMAEEYLKTQNISE